jgi:hypothetical protein
MHHRKRVLAFDPRNGVALLGLDMENKQIYVDDFFIINPNKICKDLKPDIPIVGKEVVCLESAKNTLRELLLSIQPEYIVVETAYSGTFAQAFKVLSIWISTLSTLAYLTLKRRVYGFAPDEWRKTIGTGTNKKEICQSWLLEQTTIQGYPLHWNRDKGLLVSHTSDAVMVGLALAVTVFSN